jgi:hypothetical protein
MIYRRFFYVVTTITIPLAFTSGILLLLFDTPQAFFQGIAHAPLSAAPLLLIGVASLCFQCVIRPKLLDFCKALIVSAAFLLWGIDQLLHAGKLATTLGDVVIVLYVIDLGWMMLERIKQHGWPVKNSKGAGLPGLPNPHIRKRVERPGNPAPLP